MDITRSRVERYMKYEFVNVPIPAAAHLLRSREDMHMHTHTHIAHDDGNSVPTPSTFLNKSRTHEEYTRQNSIAYALS